MTRKIDGSDRRVGSLDITPRWNRSVPAGLGQSSLLSRRRFMAGLALLGPIAAACNTASPGSAGQPAPAAAGHTIRGGAAGPDTVVVGNFTEATTLNPIISNDGPSQLVWDSLIFESLVKPDPATGGPTPWLAERWEQSPDGLSYTFHLRPNVKWSDGQPFTGEDVKFTFETILDPKTKTALRSNLDKVASLTAPDTMTVKINLKEASCPLLLNAMVLPIVPKHLLANSADFNTDEFGTTRPIGTGPYTFAEWRKDEYIRLVANPGYWRGKPKIGEWIRKIVKDETVLAAQLKTGEVDAAQIQPEGHEDLNDQPQLTVLPFLSATLNSFVYNLDRPIFQDKRVRQALAYALDRDNLVRSLFNGAATVANSPVLTDSWAFDKSVPTYAFNPDKARQLLRDAGWSPGPDGVLQKDGAPFKFAIATNTGNKTREAVMTVAQDQWRKVGIMVEQQIIQLALLNDKLQKTHDFDAILAGAPLGADPDQTTRWSTKDFPGGQNYGHYSSPAVDALLDQARSAGGCDQAARKAIYDRFQQAIAEDQPVTFLYQPKTTLVSRKALRGPAPTVWAKLTTNVADWSWDA